MDFKRFSGFYMEEDEEELKDPDDTQDSDEIDIVEDDDDDDGAISIDMIDDMDDEEDPVEDYDDDSDEDIYIDTDDGDEYIDNDEMINIPEPKPTGTIDVKVDMTGFGTDNSPIQNQYNPKEIERLNNLLASENSAIGEYFQASKETNVDILRRLYSDIGEEERFHSEQLLFAKSQITGEPYVPRDENVKREYEELLSMGMDEESAMMTAVDKVGLMRKQQAQPLTAEETVEEMFAIVSNIETVRQNMYQEYLLYKISESNAIFSTRERDKAIGTYLESYMSNAISDEFILEEVNNVTEKDPNANNKGGIIKGFIRLITGIGNAIKSMLGNIGRFFKKTSAYNRAKMAWLKNHKFSDLFKEGFKFYFYNDTGANAGFAFNDAAKYLFRIVNCCKQIAAVGGVNFNFDSNKLKFKQDFTDNKNFSTIEAAITDIKNVVMTKTKVVVNDANQEMFLNNALGVATGNTTDNVNPMGAYAKFQALLEDFTYAINATNEMLKKFEEMEGVQGSMYYRDRDKYNKLVDYIKAAIKGYQMFSNCITHDINVLMKVDSEFTRAAVSESKKAEGGGTETEVPKTEVPKPETGGDVNTVTKKQFFAGIKNGLAKIRTMTDKNKIVEQLNALINYCNNYTITESYNLTPISRWYQEAGTVSGPHSGIKNALIKIRDAVQNNTVNINTLKTSIANQLGSLPDFTDDKSVNKLNNGMWLVVKDIKKAEGGGSGTETEVPKKETNVPTETDTPKNAETEVTNVPTNTDVTGDPNVTNTQMDFDTFKREFGMKYATLSTDLVILGFNLREALNKVRKNSNYQSAFKMFFKDKFLKSVTDNFLQTKDLLANMNKYTVIGESYELDTTNNVIVNEMDFADDLSSELRKVMEKSVKDVEQKTQERNRWINDKYASLTSSTQIKEGCAELCKNYENFVNFVNDTNPLDLLNVKSILDVLRQKDIW